MLLCFKTLVNRKPFSSLQERERRLSLLTRKTNTKITPMLEPIPDQTSGKESMFPDAMSVSGFKKPRSVTSGQPSLVNVPDFREQRGKLLVLKTKGKDLLRVDAA